ncbi:Eukaryotic elongation factor 2 kinase [Fasciola hepatica]|uniref:Eukaryotic elongation factor 2 kinase n=1 Tax=Fasciola hepatica TaxID=6192 RepID=A0A4E0RHA7_FASHE|nr:Eukaryotic elongation factor 2 kinase [Fasciola hepatica]
MGYPDETEAEEDPMSHSSGLNSKSAEAEATNTLRPAQMWKRALKKLQSVDLDPWLDFQTHHIPAQTAVRHRYNVIKKKWVVDEIQVKIERNLFDRGAMRECFRLKKLPQFGVHANDWQYASNYVAKRYINTVDKQVYFDDVRLQMEAKLWGEAFNRQNPPKKVDIFQLSVLELRGVGLHDHNPGDGGAGDSPAASIKAGCFYHIERYMEGEYRKYNSNSGFVDEQLRNTPQAFSHFTFERSGHRLLVVDIQGVGDLYTDPQIHTADGVGYSDGNLGPRGMAFFFHSHRCNPLCEWLGLTAFDLAPSELGTNTPLYPQPSVHTRTDEDGEEPSVANASSSPKDENSKLKKIHVDGSPGEVVKPVANPVSHPRGPFARRRAVSFSQSHVRLPNHGIRFGPTVTRSTENMNHLDSRLRRRNSESLSYSSDEHPSSSAGFILFNGSSLSNLLDPDGDETASIGPFTTLKLDTMAPLMHENHKPSCADHPTNLDQEIGHSILGQIHHELARLHEAGRFLPNCKGGWSHAGLGGLLLKNHNLDDSDDEAVHHGPENPTNFADLSPNGGGDDGSSLVRFSGQSIDWAAVLFHERHAAQLGCLEAMIVMAHYYLGLPTQLMLDCPIKPNQSDLRSGVDYLGRAAEGGDRRCMILLSRFLDVSASLSDSTHAVSKTAGPDDFLLLPALTSASRDAVPLISSDPWVEAISWYKKAVDTAGDTSPGDGAPDEGLDAEGRYDAAKDLLPVYRILARMAEMYSIGGFGLKQNFNMAGDLFTQAGELASAARQGRLAAKYFEFGEEAYSNCE